MQDATARNRRRSFVLLGGFAGLVALVLGGAAAVSGAGGLVVAVGVVVGALAAAVAYGRADAVVLAAGRAVEADPGVHARYHNLVDGLCAAIGLPKPRLYVVDDVAPNAFATGRDPKHAAVAVTTGLLDLLDRVELEAVFAEELRHIKDRDTMLGAVAVTTAGLPTLVADLLVRCRWWNGGRLGRDDRAGGAVPFLGSVGMALLALAPVLAWCLHRALGVDRAAVADARAVEVTRYPPAMISALEKLAGDTTVTHAGLRATAHLWFARPIATDPAEGHLVERNARFDTHPPVSERVAALGEL